MSNKLYSLKENLSKANERLKEVLAMEETQVNRDATIQRFEFCFELAWKSMKEYAKDQGVACNSPKNCIREAGVLELVDDVEKWLVFLEARNSTVHIYDASMAKTVFEEVKNLPGYIDRLLAKLN